MADENENSTRLVGQLLYSERFDDFYSARLTPDQEKSYVFCTGNDLEARFPTAQNFTIVELGFGAGLGFLAAAHLWRETATADARLNFISIEKYPLERDKLRSFLRQFPQWEKLSETLLAHWPVATPGFHRIDLPDTGITLTLIFSEVLGALQQLEANVDAWFLDGFSPAKNPAMWRPEVLKEIARLSYRQTTVATYTAAGKVRRDLTAAGFTMSRKPGFGQKRERLVGHFRPQRASSYSRIHPHLRPLSKKYKKREVTIVGAGLAGCACANRLAARGYQITLLEAGDTLASGTSDNPAAIMQPFLSQDDNLASRFSREGYWYTLHRVQQLESKGIDSGFHHTGLFSLPKDDADRKRKEAIVGSHEWPEAYFSWQVRRGFNTKGIWYPATGWFDLGRFCRALIDEFKSAITVMTNHRVEALSSDGDTWTLTTSQGDLQSERVIIANGHSATRFQQSSHLPLLANCGQITAASTTSPPELAISKKGYVVPVDDRTVFFGSTYELDTAEALTKTENDLNNLQALQQISNTLHNAIDQSTLRGWSGIRATSSDHLPLVGEVPQPASYTEIFGPFLHGRKMGQSTEPPFYSGLYCCTGLGSRAMTSGVLSGELIAAVINAEPIPVERAVFEAVHPARFLSRRLASNPVVYSA